MKKNYLMNNEIEKIFFLIEKFNKRYKIYNFRTI